MEGDPTRDLPREIKYSIAKFFLPEDSNLGLVAQFMDCTEFIEVDVIKGHRLIIMHHYLTGDKSEVVPDIVEIIAFKDGLVSGKYRANGLPEGMDNDYAPNQVMPCKSSNISDWEIMPQGSMKREPYLDFLNKAMVSFGNQLTLQEKPTNLN